MITPGGVALGSYEATDAVFDYTYQERFDDDAPFTQDACTFQSTAPVAPVRGGVHTPPFYYKTDPTATFSVTTYRKTALGKRHDATCREPVCNVHGKILDGRVSCWLCKLECREETARRRAAIIRTFQHRDGTMTEKNRRLAELYATRCLTAQPDAPLVKPVKKKKKATQQLLPGAGPAVPRSKKTRKPYCPPKDDRTDFRLSGKGFRVVTESASWGDKKPKTEERDVPAPPAPPQKAMKQMKLSW